jgi:flagellar assembly factor FliW
MKQCPVPHADCKIISNSTQNQDNQIVLREESYEENHNLCGEPSFYKYT